MGRKVTVPRQILRGSLECIQIKRCGATINSSRIYYLKAALHIQKRNSGYYYDQLIIFKNVQLN